MPFCHAGAEDSDRRILGVARMRRPENRDRDSRITPLLHQIHDRRDQIDLGVERLAHSQTAKAAQGCGRESGVAHPLGPYTPNYPDVGGLAGEPGFVNKKTHGPECLRANIEGVRGGSG